MLVDSQINVIRLLNPFDPRDRVYEVMEWSPEKTLDDYFPANVITGDYVVSVNGKTFMPEEFEHTRLLQGDNVVVCAVPYGGGDDSGGKSVLRIVAIIALSIITAGAAAAYGAAMGAALGTSAAIGGAIVSAGISIVGGMLINALLPPPKPKQPEQPQNTSGNSTATYGADGPKNISAEGVPVPVSYGTFRQGGNSIGTYTINNGNNQTLYMLFNAGEGPISAITDIEINDQPIANYKDAECLINLGLPDQDPIPWFQNAITPIPVNLNVVNATWINYTTTKGVDKFRIDISFPNGLCYVDIAGNIVASSVDFIVQYKKHTDSVWTDLKNTKIVSGYTDRYVWTGIYNFDPHGSGDILTLTPYVPTGGEVRNGDLLYSPYGQLVGHVEHDPIYTNGIEITEASRSTVRRSFESDVLDNDVYDIRIKRVSPQNQTDSFIDNAYVTDINEIELDAVAHKHTACVAIKIPLSAQLNGIPKVTYLNHGRVLRVWDADAGIWTSQASANPAWIVVDILTNKRFGGGRPLSRFDLSAYKDWAQFCADNGFEFNGIFDSQTTIWDGLQAVYRMGRAQQIQVGTRFSVAIERPDDPVQMFTMGNIIQGSFKETWLPTTGRANEIEVTYYDKNDGYKQKSLKVYDPNGLINGSQPVTASINLIGCVEKERAAAEGTLQLNLNRYILQTVEFGAPLDALACTVGSLILVQHDMPQWGYGGRLAAGSTSTVINLDIPVARETGKNYKLLVMFDAVQRYTGTVLSVTGNGIVLGSFDASLKVKRIKIGTSDLEVEQVYDAGSGNYGVIVPDASGVVIGSIYSLWDTDVLEEHDVVNDNATSSTVTVTSAFSSAPTRLQNWMYGEVNKVKKPFRVKSISGSHDYRRDITAIEYNASVYDPSGNVIPTPNYSALSTVCQQSVIDSVKEYLVLSAGLLRTRVTVYFTNPDFAYRDSKVLCSVNGAPFYVVDSGAFDRASIEASDGDVVVFKVVGRNLVGTLAVESSAPTITHTVLGKQAPPSDVTGLSVSNQSTDLFVRWDAVTDIDLAGYELRLDSNFGVDDANRLFIGLATNWKDKPRAAGPYTYHVKAFDTSGNYSSNETTVSHSIANPPTPAPAAVISAGDVVVTWTSVNADFLIDYYELRLTDAGVNAVTLKQVSATTFKFPASWSGNKTIEVRAVDIAGNAGAWGTTVLNIAVPGAVSVIGAVDGQTYKLTWTAPTASLPIKEYEIRYGSSWATGVPVATVAGLSYSAAVDFGSTRQFFIRAKDVIDNPGDDTGNASISVAPPGVPSLSYTISADALKIEITGVLGSLPIKGYDIRYGTSWAAGTPVAVVTGNVWTRSVDFGGSRTYWAAPIDTGNNVGTAGSVVVNILPPSAPAVTSALSGTDLALFWTPAPGSLSIAEYEIRYGTTYTLGTYIARQKGTSLKIPVDWIGNRDFWIIAIDSAGNQSIVAGNAFVPIAAPAAPSMHASFSAENCVLTWDVPAASLPIEDYEIRYGADWSSGTSLGRVKATTLSFVAKWLGIRNFFIGAYDQKGNLGAIGTSSATVSAAPPTQVTFQVIDNNVLLYWQQVAGTLPTKTYEIRRGGPTWNDAEPIGTKSGGFTSIFETASGTYMYWVAAIDSADNYGTPSSATANVNQPPDYVLKISADSLFTGTKHNMLQDIDGSYLMPINTTESFSDHFVNNGWATPQDQINAGYPIFAQPTPGSAYYEEVIDYGALLAANRITVAPTFVAVSGTCTVQCDITVAQDSGFTTGVQTFTNQFQVYATSFSYLKYRITVTGADPTALDRLKAINVRLDSKLKTISGMLSCVSTDVGGTVLYITDDRTSGGIKEFVDVDAITITPQGTTPITVVYDFVDTPYPLSMKVLLFNSSGTRISGTVSYVIRGY